MSIIIPLNNDSISLRVTVLVTEDALWPVDLWVLCSHSGVAWGVESSGPELSKAMDAHHETVDLELSLGCFKDWIMEEYKTYPENFEEALTDG